MNTRSILLGCTVLFGGIFGGLAPVLAAPPAAPPAASPPADTPAVTVVREFLADRAAGKYDAAYALLSASSQQSISKTQFTAGDPSPFGNDHTQPATLMGVGSLFVDTHNTSGYTFTVVGPDIADPGVALVQAGRAGMPAVALRLLTVTDPLTHAPRLDVFGSLERTAPNAFASARAAAQEVASQSNLKQIALGIIQYAQDHDKRLPDAANWVDEIMPYFKTEAIFHDPSAPAGEHWSYAYNRALSHQPLAALDSPVQTVLLFESNLGVKNASDTGQSVPVPGRHRGGIDFAQADGHVRWVPDGTKLSYRLDGK